MPCQDDELQPPCLEALLAGTFALMTCWATPSEEGQMAAQPQKELMARKIVSNLFFLKEHPHASPGMQQVMARAHARWVPLARCPGCQPDNVDARARDSEAQHGIAAGSLLH